VVRKKQLKYHLPVFAKTPGIGLYPHSSSGRSGAGRLQTAAFSLDHAHPARAVDRQLRMIAKGRKVYARLPYQLKYIFLAINLYGNVVNNHIFPVRHGTLLKKFHT
jgi:hypothetical protein